MTFDVDGNLPPDGNPVSYREKNHWNSDFDVDGIAPPDGHPVTFDVDLN